jgi:SAM-dependent methyltransferase
MAAQFWERTLQCRACGGSQLVPVVSFGDLPLADKLRRERDSESPGAKAPLQLVYCQGCSLSQLSVSVLPSIIYDADYRYYSSVSPTLSRHFKESATRLIASYGVGSGSTVIEAGSNDGYMLRHFKQAGATVLGFDPAYGPASAAIEQGIDTSISFFGIDSARKLAARNIRADIFLANNVLAHVPDLLGFVAGIATVLKPTGTAVIEVPYLADLVSKREFDTIYHQHLCYFTMTSLGRLFARAGLRVVNAERIPIHGGSLRLSVGHGKGGSEPVVRLVEEERMQGWHELGFVMAIAAAAETLRRDLRNLVGTLRGQGQTLCGYGAAAKATTLLALCDLDSGELGYIADLNPLKHGLFMPGTDLKIVEPDEIRRRHPDYVVILAWNFAEEIICQLADYRKAGGKFIIPIPDPKVIV